MTLHGVRVNVSRRHIHSIRRRNQAEMAESEAIQSIVMQMAIQVAMAVVIVMRGRHRAVSGANIAIVGEACRQRHGEPVFKQLSFNWSAPDKHVELLHFEIEVTNTLQT